MAGGGGGEPGKVRAGCNVGRRNAHQAGDGGPEPGLALPDKGIGVGRGYAGLLWLVTNIDLDEIVRALAVLVLGLNEGVQQTRAVQYLDDVGQANGVAGLVRLQAADQMQPQLRVGGAQRNKLGRSLLHAIFAEFQMPGLQQRQNVVGRVGFTDRDQLGRGPAGLRGGSGNPGLECGVAIEERTDHGS